MSCKPSRSPFTAPLNFKLKSVAKALYHLGMISVNWTSSSQCDQGLNAMTALFLCDQEARAKGTGMQGLPLMQEIVGYNRIDCEAMMEVVEYLRAWH